jgi:hypothetical protein
MLSPRRNTFIGGPVRALSHAVRLKTFDDLAVGVVENTRRN